MKKILVMGSFLLVSGLSLLAGCGKRPTESDRVSSQEQEGVLMEGFEDADDWLLTGGPGSLKEADLVHCREGRQSIRLTAAGGTEACAAKAVDLALSSMRNVIFWIYVYDSNKLHHIRLLLSPTSDFSKCFAVSISHDIHNPFKPGWNRFVIARSAFRDSGGASWGDAIVRIRLECGANAEEDAGVSFDDLRYNYPGRAACILTFDDGHESIFTKAFPIMRENGQSGVAFIITERPGLPAYMTKANLEVLRDAGWDISNHTRGHANLAELSPAQLELEVNLAYDWLVANGFAESAGFFAYPGGYFNDAVVEKVRENHKIARSTIVTTFQPHFELGDDNIDMLVKFAGPGHTQTPEIVKGWIDQTIEQGGLLVLMFHRIVDSNPGGIQMYYEVDSFKKVSDYLRSKDSEIDVVTFGAYYRDYLHGR